MIEKPKAGDPVADLFLIVAQLCDAVNALQNLSIGPEGSGTVVPGYANMRIDLSPIVKRLPPAPPASGTHVLGSVDGKWTWFDKDICAGGG
ncbi:MAG: hypothetical protein QOD99_1915 [Chthoniobacter sp.]|jgi:hypothetical protein|nr:hypothetical protein [Chthoniobacter sp.]